MFQRNILYPDIKYDNIEWTLVFNDERDHDRLGMIRSTDIYDYPYCIREARSVPTIIT